MLWEARLGSYKMADRILDVTPDMTAAEVADRLVAFVQPAPPAAGTA